MERHELTAKTRKRGQIMVGFYDRRMIALMASPSWC